MFINTTDQRNYLLLQQLNDSLFPIGSFTHSYGLETYVQQNKITDVDSFYHYLIQIIDCSFLYNELLAIKLAYGFAKDKAIDQLIYLDQLITATKPAYEIRQASIKLGSRFIKTITKIGINSTNDSFTKYCQKVELNLIEGHHALAYGALCGSLDLPYDCSVLKFNYSQLSGMINTGVKLIPLCQTLAQKLLYKLQPAIINAIDKLEKLSIDDLGRSTPGFELRSQQHEKLYSRMYMS